MRQTTARFCTAPKHSSAPVAKFSPGKDETPRRRLRILLLDEGSALRRPAGYVSGYWVGRSARAPLPRPLTTASADVSGRLATRIVASSSSAARISDGRAGTLGDSAMLKLPHPRWLKTGAASRSRPRPGRPPTQREPSLLDLPQRGSEATAKSWSGTSQASPAPSDVSRRTVSIVAATGTLGSKPRSPRHSLSLPPAEPLVL
jgi:hypothetical protein